MRWMGHQRWFIWTAAKLAPLDAKVVRRSGGKFGLLGNYGLPQCLLTTVGRKSGQPRTVTLLYGTLKGEIILVGSNFGQSHHPAWALNLEADPKCVLSTNGDEYEMVSRLISDPETREDIWQLMADVWPAYNLYRGTAGRQIKIFALTPVGDRSPVEPLH